MGCLFEFIFELVFEIVATIYIELMTLIVPKRQFEEKQREKIKGGVAIFALLLFVCAFIGFVLFLQPPSVAKTVGAYMLFIPLGIMGVQIVAGIIYQIIKAIKNRHSS